MTRQKLHTLVDAQYDQLDALQQEPTFLAFERQFTHVWITLGKQVLQASIGKSPVNPRKKNGCQTRFGTVEVAQAHRFNAKTNGFFISPYFQKLMAITGVSDVYSVANDLLERLLGIPISMSQVYRVTNLLGQQLTSDLAQPISHSPLQDGEVIYASIDGSMILTNQGCGAAL